MKKLLALAAVLSCTSLFAGYVPPLGKGQSETWTGAAGDGSWNNSQNWSGKVLPSATIGVYIPGDTTIDVEGNSAANWIETTGSGSVLINGDGTLQIAGLATTNGASLSFGCNLVPAAMLHSVGAFTIANGGTFSLSYPWVESGDVTVQAGANMTLQGSNNSPHMPISGNLINQGTISVVDCPLTVAGNFTQDGALTVSNGYATAETWTTGGSINLQNSQVIGNGPWTVNGVTTIIFLAATNRFTFPSSYGQTWSGSVSIEGWVDYPNNRIQVGNNPCGLSVAQLNSIAFQGVGGQERNGCLNAYGYVTPNTNGLLPPFVFSNQPLSEVNVAYGGNLQLSVSTSRPSSTEYQWQLNGTSIPGAIGPNYINRGVTGAADGDYACVVTSDDLTMTSTVANVVVGPKLLKGPLPQKANGNGPFEFTASATGGEPLQYQWLLNGNAISGATNSTYGSANAQPADAGSYSVIVSNRAGSVTSGKARLVVLPYITAQPTNEYNLLGDAVTLTLTAIAPSSEGNLHSLWYYKGDSYRPTTASQTDDGTTKTLVSTFTFKVGKNQEVIHAWIDNNDGGTNSETVTINQRTKNPLAITIFSPVNNSTITNQTSATVSAEATTPNLGAAVTNISYYANGALIGKGSSATLTGLTAGSHTVAVVAADSFGVLTTNSVTFNIAIYAPTVSVSAPSHGAINSPETITINTVITGPGSVQSVQLLANGTIVGTSSAGNNGQFTFSWTPTTAGTFTLTAAATTSYGASGTSPAVNFLSYVPSPPVVTLTPASETLTNAASITLNASAVTQGVGNSITNITIFDGNTSLGSTLPIIISNPSGTHTYKAVASDQYGTQGSASSTIQFLAVTPIVSITAPPHGGLGTNQTITVNAANVPVQSVQFLVNGTAVATSSTGNNGVYSFTWSPSTAENYSLSGSATTANNLTGTSSSTIFAGFVPAAPVVTLIPTGAIMTNVTTVSISANAIGETYPGIAITNLSIFDGTNLLVTANTGTASTTVTNPAAGTHTYSAVAADAYGVVGTITSTLLFTNIPVGDLIPPIVTISGPTTGPEYLPQTFTVFASNNGPGTISGTSLMINGSLVQSEGYSTGVFYWTPPTNGTYTISASANTPYGQVGYATPHTFTATNYAAPTVAITQPAGTATAGQVVVSAGSSDPEGQANTIAIYIDNTNVLTGAGPILTGLLSTNMLLAGQHSIWAYVSDAYAGSYSTTNQLTLQGSQTPIIWSDYGSGVTINGTQQPQISGSLSGNGGAASTQAIPVNSNWSTITYAAPNNASATAAGTELMLSTTPNWTMVGHYTVVADYEIWDAGNSESGLSLISYGVPNWDGSGFCLGNGDSLVWQISTGNMIQGQIVESNGTVRISTPWETLTPGTPLYMGVYNNGGAGIPILGAIAATNLPYTNIAPATPTLTLYGGNHTGKTTDTYFAYETLQVAFSNISTANVGDMTDHIDFHQVFNGIDAVLVTVSNSGMNGTVTVLNPTLPGPNFTVYANVVARSGASTPSASVTVNVSATTPPTVSLTSPGNYSTVPPNYPVAASVSASDPQGYPLTVVYYLDGVAYQTNSASPYGGTLTIASSGYHTLYATANDGTYISYSGTNTFGVQFTPPTITLAPASGAVLSPGTITLAATATDNEGETITATAIYLNGGSIGLSLSGALTVQQTLAVGVYSAYASASDASGTANSSTATFAVDTAPTVSVSMPSSVTNLTATNINYQLSANFPCTVTGYANGTQVFTVNEATGNGSGAWTPSSMGTYTIKVVATDQYGLSATNSTSVTVVELPPTVTITAPTNGASVYAKDSLITTINVTGQNHVTLKIYTNSVLMTTQTNILGTYSFSWTPTTIGANTITAIGTDTNNFSSTNTVSFTVQSNAPPTITLSDANYSTVPPGVITFWANATEIDGKPFILYLYINGQSVVTNNGPTASYTTNIQSGTITLSALVVDALYNTYSPTNTVNISPTAQTMVLLAMNGANNGTSFPDSSVYNMGGTANGSAHTTTNAYIAGGSSLVLTGATTNYVSLTGDNWRWNLNSSNYVVPITVEAWVAIEAAGRYNVIAANGNLSSSSTSWAVYIDSNNKPNMAVYDNTASTWRVATGTTALATNTWYNVYAYFDGSEAHIWLNGVQQATSAAVEGISEYNEPLTIGAGYAEAGGAVAGFDGYIDEFRMTQGGAIYSGSYVPLDAPGTNLAPMVNFVTPSSNMVASTSINLQASAVCPGLGDYVTNVVFLSGGSQIGSATTTTGGYYSYSWTPAAGNYSVQVAAYNELGNCLTSAPIAINVTNYLIWTPVGSGVSTTQNGTVLVFNHSAAGAYAYASISGVPNGYQVNMLTPTGGQSSFTWEVISTTSGNFVNWGLDTDNTSWLVYQSENQNGHLNNVIGSGVNLPLLHTSNGSWSDNYWTLGLSGNVQFEIICQGTLTVGPFTVVP